MKTVREVDLAVHGTKIAVYRTQQLDTRTRSSSYSLKHLHVTDQLPVHSHRDTGNDTYREVFKLKTASVSNSAIQSDLLREIRESVEIEDLRRLLRPLGEERGGDGKGGKVVTSVDAAKIHRDYYQVHYDFLRHVLEES